MTFLTEYTKPHPTLTPRLFGGHVIAKSWDDAQGRAPDGHRVVGRVAG